MIYKILSATFCIGGILCGIATIHDLFPNHSDKILKLFIRPAVG